MNPKKQSLLWVIFIAFLFVSNGVHAQTPAPPYMPKVFPPSPNAASLMKFTDVPVSPYTGTADVSIPFYVVQAKGLNIPVSIAYHTGGIRVAEDAGVVGLGWALNAGGMISRTVRDKDDLLSDYFSGVLPLKPGDLSPYQTATAIAPELQSTPFNANKYLFCFTCSYNVNMASGDVADYSGVFSTASSGTSTSDTEPDSYSYNFAGHSGKFIIKPDRTFVLEKQDNIRIKINAAPGGGSIGYITFTITDENGNTYYFNAMEFGGTLSDASTLSSWHLSKIVTQQNDVINFNYVQTGWIHTPQDAIETYRGANCDGNGFNYSPNITSVYSNYKLQGIDFTDGQLQFVYDDTRLDLNGGSKLTAVKVYSKGKAGLKFIKENDLYYSYFNGNGSPVNVDKARLRLDSVKEVGVGTLARPYSFVYNTSGADMADKHSKAIDHWGYYNGAGNTTLIPSQSIHYAAQGILDTQLDFSGANRDPSSIMDVFSLKQITYPTGGKSVFEFSPNEYDYDKSIVGVNEYPQMTIVTLDTLIIVDKYGTTSGTFDLKSVVSGTDINVNVAFISKINQGWPNQDRNGYGKLYFTLESNQVDLSNSGLNCGGPACSTSITAYANNGNPSYSWHAYVDSSIPTTDFSLIHVLIQYKAYKLKAQQANGIYIVQAGGLKINSVTDYSSDGVVAKKRVWEYSYTSTNGHQYSYGRLMSMPSYAHLEPTTWHQGQGVCRAIVLFSSSNTSLSSAIQGNIVGYSRVNEYTVDPATNENIGKTEYNFFNSPDSTIFYNGYRMPGTLNMGNHLNGSLLSTRIFRNTGSAFYKVKETYNYFHTANRIVYFTPKYELPMPYNYYGVFPGVCNNQVAIPVAMYGMFYPLIKSERILQDSTREVTYDQNDTLKYLTTVSKSYYDNPAHYQLTRSSMVDQKGDLHVSKITYPQDYITSGSTTGNMMLDTLIRRNMVTASIEKSDSLYYKGSSAGFVTGASVSRYRQLLSGAVVADKQYKLDLLKPVTDFVPMSVSGNVINQDSRYRQLINFDAYDDKNNIAQYTATGQLPVSVLWDYNQTSPIAQVKNADTTAIAYTSFEADGTGGWVIGSALRDNTTSFSGGLSYNLTNGSITRGGLTASTTYVVSYWTRNAAPLIIAGTLSGSPIKGATIKGWTYYEHQVTGQTTVTVSGTGNIDELRLYPKGAQMTTYTYNPLIGVSGSVDMKNVPTYYEYDGLGRLRNIKDYQGNIVKSFDYNYRPQ